MYNSLSRVLFGLICLKILLLKSTFSLYNFNFFVLQTFCYLFIHRLSYGSRLLLLSCLVRHPLWVHSLLYFDIIVYIQLFCSSVSWSINHSFVNHGGWCAGALLEKSGSVCRWRQNCGKVTRK